MSLISFLEVSSTTVEIEKKKTKRELKMNMMFKKKKIIDECLVGICDWGGIVDDTWS